MSDRDAARRRRRLRVWLGLTACVGALIAGSLFFRVEWSATRTGPQPWILLSDTALTFGAGELAGGPGTPGFLVGSGVQSIDFDVVPFFRTRDGWFLARLPMWIPLAITAIPTLVLWRRGRATTAGRCPRCHYDLTGHDAARCPECGARA